MADLIAQTLSIVNLVSASGAVRFQLLAGPVGNQFLVADLEFTAAQNAAMSTALAAAAGTITNFAVPAAPSPLVGVYNAI